MVFRHKTLQYVTTYAQSFAAFGAAGGLAFLYVTDWKAVLKYVPYYGGKYPPEPEESK